MKQADALMSSGVAKGVFPGGVLLISKERKQLFCKAYGQSDIFFKMPMTRETIFDLASLTKPLATTLAVMKLIEQKKIFLEQSVASILPGFGANGKNKIMIRNLLFHNSGLPDYREYYKDLRKLSKNKRRAALRGYLLKEPLLYPVGKKTLYSDLGFMILGWIVETAAGRSLDRFTEEEIYAPLKLGAGSLERLFFVDLKQPEIEKDIFAATEVCPWRKILLKGAVHDDNAYVTGGVAGHAGLFGNAGAVFKLLSFIVDLFHGRAVDPYIFDRNLMRQFLRKDEYSGRASGFDTPSLTGSSSGRFFSKKSVGHLGFTGTSFWIDLERSVIIILLTNRVHPSRQNNKIKVFRPKLHDSVMKNFL